MKKIDDVNRSSFPNLKGNTLVWSESAASEPESAEMQARETMSLEQSHSAMSGVKKARRLARTPQLQMFEAYDAAEDVGTVRLLWLEAALKARRVPESEG